jgi:hypothetical protein
MGGKTGMSDDLIIPVTSHEREFWKRYRTLRRMTEHIKAKNLLVHLIRAETVIPEQARDMAVHAIMSELTDQYQIYFEYIDNFIKFCAQGLHRVDFHVDFTILSGGIYEIESCYLIIDGKKENAPFEIGKRFIDILPYSEGWEAILAVYRRIETRYDQKLEGNLNHCSLLITSELYPTSGYHISLTLPAQTLIDHPDRG